MKVWVLMFSALSDPLYNIYWSICKFYVEKVKIHSRRSHEGSEV
jgi:hypothetical protein